MFRFFNDTATTLNDYSQYLINYISASAHSLYESMPASFNGLHYRELPYLPGHLFLGRALNVAKGGGLGLGDDLKLLADLAKQHPKGMAYCTISNQPTLLITKPEHIKQLMLHDSSLSKGDILAAFSRIFGNENVVSIESYHNAGEVENKIWRTSRNELIKWVYSDNELKNISVQMQQIIDRFFDDLESHHINEPMDLDKLMVKLAMQVFCESRLGTGDITAAADNMSEAIGQAFADASDPFNTIKVKLAEQFEKFTTVNLAVDERRKSLHNTFKTLILDPQKEKILEENNVNLLKSFAVKDVENQSGVPVDLHSKTVLRDGCMLVLAGHETTSRLMQFTLMLLNENPACFSRMCEEIEAAEKAMAVDANTDEIKWTRENVKSLDYTIRVLKESLRLYPPIPILPRTVTKPITIDGIQITKNTTILISPLITHMLESVHPDPLSFNPDRFKTSSIEPKGLDSQDDDPYAWFPFGVGHRKCIGLRFAMQEACLILVRYAKLIKSHNATIVTDNTHPYNTFIRGSLLNKDQVTIQIRPH